MTATIIRGNALALPLEASSVDLIVTSPPYFGLRSYQDGGEHYAGQIGAEPTPAEFVDALIAATGEMVRVLKPSGSIWVNLGDKYAGSNAGGASSSKAAEQRWSDALAEGNTFGQRYAGVYQGPLNGGAARPKSLMGIPWRYAIRCIDDLGLTLRAEVIWSKPNGLPESVTDRVRRSHETWFHFTKQPRYFSAVDEIREPTGNYAGATWSDRKLAGIPSRAGQQTTETMGTVLAANPLGKLPGSVWSIPTQPLKVPAELGIDHFAAFPMEFPRRIIQGWSPAGVCTACGEGRRPVTHAEPSAVRWDSLDVRQRVSATSSGGSGKVSLGPGAQPTRTITGYACACTPYTDHAGVDEAEGGWGSYDGDRSGAPAANGKQHVAANYKPKLGPWREYHYDRWTPAPTTPGVVLDPFGGTGTTALVADALGRRGVSVDMSADYCRLAEWRTTDPGQRAAAAQVEKPAPASPDQLDLFS